MGVESAKRDTKRRMVLSLTDGRTVSSFDLVVGADGVWGNVRPLVSIGLEG